jgi:hypothetical protein
MPSKTASKRELVEPHTGDKRYVRRKADGTFGKTVDVGRSLSAGEIRPLPPVSKPTQAIEMEGMRLEDL